MNPNGGSTPEQQGYSTQPGIEPGALEYSGRDAPTLQEEAPALGAEFQAPPQEMPPQGQEMPYLPPEAEQPQYESTPMQTEYPGQPTEAPMPNIEGTYGPQEGATEPQNDPEGYTETPQTFEQPETYTVTPDGQEVVTPESAPVPQQMYHFPQQEMQPQQTPQVEARPQQIPQQELYTQQAERFVETSRTPEFQTQLRARKSKEGELVYVNPNLDPSLGQQGSSSSQGQVTTQQVTSQIGGYPVSHTVSGNPQAALIQQIVQSGDPHSANTWHAVIVNKLVKVLLRMLPGS